uniref:Uncharacterized protein n=1 Tax=Amphimedon queenslandica TaxID=400682 RepID=A0A1X7VM05_AMPQE
MVGSRETERGKRKRKRRERVNDCSTLMNRDCTINNDKAITILKLTIITYCNPFPY